MILRPTREGVARLHYLMLISFSTLDARHGHKIMLLLGIIKIVLPNNCVLLLHLRNCTRGLLNLV